jgi:CRISPR-associated exonuclease Cas4
MTNPDDSSWLLISGLQHWIFCKRQCGLIHVANVWQENALTHAGHALHRRTDTPGYEQRPGIRIARALPLVSNRFGLSGKADVVEFHCQPDSRSWQPYPVEYKHGRPKKDGSDAVQLCAQALCLEEMFDCTLEEGALYYGKTRRRQTVQFDENLRNSTIAAIKGMRRMIEENMLPPPEPGPKCTACSLESICMPETEHLDAHRYLKKAGL